MGAILRLLIQREACDAWLFDALISATAPALTAILAKVGVEGVPSNLATAIRTIVITGFAWGIAAATGEHRALTSVSRRSVFLLLSGITTGCLADDRLSRRSYRGAFARQRSNYDAQLQYSFGARDPRARHFT
jgi:hypothetical protein